MLRRDYLNDIDNEHGRCVGHIISHTICERWEEGEKQGWQGIERGQSLGRTPTLLLSRVSCLMARDGGMTTMLWYFPIGVGRDGMYTEHHESGRLVWSVSYYVWTGWSDNTVHIGWYNFQAFPFIDLYQRFHKRHSSFLSFLLFLYLFYPKFIIQSVGKVTILCRKCVIPNSKSFLSVILHI